MAEKEMLDGAFIGTVIKVDKDNRRVGVYIPKLMPGMYSGDEQSYTVPTNNGLDVPAFDTMINSTINKINYMWVKPLRYEDPLPNVGSKIYIEFLDNNITQGFFKEFNPNNDYTVIEEEKHKKLLSFGINNNMTDIKDDDSLNISFPDYYKVIKTNKDGVQQYTVSENFNFYKNETIETAISNLQKTVEYIQEIYLNTFVTTITDIIASPSETDYATLYSNFIKYKEEALSEITDSENLLEKNNLFIFYNKLLNGLNSVFNKYVTYKNKYVALSEEAKTLTNITLDEINSSIEDVFADSILDAKNDVETFVTESENKFPETVTYNFVYYTYAFVNNDSTYKIVVTSSQNMNEADTKKEFSIFDTVDLSSINTKLNSIYYLGTADYTGVYQNVYGYYDENSNSSIKCIGWKHSDGTFLTDTSKALSDDSLYPVFAGFGIDIANKKFVIINSALLDESKFEYYVINNLTNDTQTKDSIDEVTAAIESGTTASAYNYTVSVKYVVNQEIVYDFRYNLVKVASETN